MWKACAVHRYGEGGVVGIHSNGEAIRRLVGKGRARKRTLGEPEGPPKAINKTRTRKKTKTKVFERTWQRSLPLTQ